MKLTIYLSLAFFIAACGAAKVSSSLTPDVLSVGQAIYPDLTMDQLNHGKELYEGKCNLCHGLKDFSKYNEASWNKIVPNMVEKVNKKVGETAIDETAQVDLLRYVVSMSAAISDPEEEAAE